MVNHILEKIDCAWIGYYCDISDHPPINGRGGTRAFDWKECGELCKENPKCNVWHYFIRGKTCFCIIVVEITYLHGKLAKHTTTSQDRNIVPIKVNDID